MATLPQLNAEDIQVMSQALSELLHKSESSYAMVLDKGGFLIEETGDSQSFDSTTLGALAAAVYAATQGIASLVGEENFTSVYQQGENYSLLINNIDEHCLLVVIFNAQISVGAVKYYAMTAITQIADQLVAAGTRSPEEGLDLSVLNLSSTADIFAQRDEEEPEAEPEAPPPTPAAPPAREEMELQSLFSKKRSGAQTGAGAAEMEDGEDDPMMKLQKIKKLLASGLITEEDFEFKKRKILEEL